MPVNILLLNAALHNPNQGVNALTIGTITALAHRFQNELNVTILGERYQQHTIQVRSGNNVLIQEVPSSGRQNIRLIFSAIGNRILNRNTTKRLSHNALDVIVNADHVIDLSAGDSFADLYGITRFLYQSLPRFAVIASGKQLVLFPQTYGPFNTSIGKRLASWLFSHSRLILTREALSTELLNEYTPKGEIIECSDMAFLMEPQPIEELPDVANSIEGFVGINISGLLLNGSDNPKYNWSNARYQDFTQALITKFVCDFGRKVILIPHVQAPNNRTDDVAASELLYASLPQSIKDSVYLVEDLLWAPHAKYLISKADFFVGARMHSCIAAASSCVPLACISYSHKFLGVFRQIGFEELVCSPEKLGNEEMLSKIAFLYTNRLTIRQQLKFAIEDARERALAAATYL